jgi:hypothetical protein
LGLLRSIASWATTGVVTVGAASGIVLSNSTIAPPTPLAVTVAHAPEKSTPKARVAEHSFVAITESVKAYSTQVRSPERRDRHGNHPLTVTSSLETVPYPRPTSTSTSSIPMTTSTGVTTTTAPVRVVTATPPHVTTTTQATTTTKPPSETTTTVHYQGDDGSGSGDT